MPLAPSALSRRTSAAAAPDLITEPEPSVESPPTSPRSPRSPRSALALPRTFTPCAGRPALRGADGRSDGTATTRMAGDPVGLDGSRVAGTGEVEALQV